MIRKVGLFTVRETMDEVKLQESQEYSSHKKNVSVVGVRFVKAINRQIQVFKKVFQKKKGV